MQRYIENNGRQWSCYYICVDGMLVSLPSKLFETDTFSAFLTWRNGKPYIRVEQEGDIVNGNFNWANYALEGENQRYVCPRNGISVRIGRHKIPY